MILTLTTREIECLNGVAAGMTNRAIGRQLGLTEGTVKVHLSKAFVKLDVRCRAHAVSLAWEYGLLGGGRS